MKIIILAAGQGTRLRPLTESKPKCMVELNGESLLERQLTTIRCCGIKEEDIYILTGYREDIIRDYLSDTKINLIWNAHFETTNMVCTLMCAEEILKKETDVVISYGDIIYTPEVLGELLKTKEELSVVVDNEWYQYWARRCDNPLDDAETLMMDSNKYLTEIGQKTTDMSKIQSQYIGLLRFKNNGVKKVLELCREAMRRSDVGKALWKTSRTYEKMYMTDLLQGLVEEGNKLKAVEINRGWYEVDCYEDLQLAEQELKEKKGGF